MILWQYIKEKMMEHPTQLVCEGQASMTYGELCDFTDGRAKTLDRHRYAILCSSEMVAMSLLSCIAAGKTAIPLPMHYGSMRQKKRRAFRTGIQRYARLL